MDHLLLHVHHAPKQTRHRKAPTAAGHGWGPRRAGIASVHQPPAPSGYSRSCYRRRHSVTQLRHARALPDARLDRGALDLDVLDRRSPHCDRCATKVAFSGPPQGSWSESATKCAIRGAQRASDGGFDARFPLPAVDTGAKRKSRGERGEPPPPIPSLAVERGACSHDVPPDPLFTWATGDGRHRGCRRGRARRSM